MRLVMKNAFISGTCFFVFLIAPHITLAAEKTISFVNIDGENLGTAKLQDQGAGVLISLDLSGIPAGVRAIHFHEKADCTPLLKEAEDPKNVFKNAGGHFNPDRSAHGILHTDGKHAGDLPNITVPTDGRLHKDIFSSTLSLDRLTQGAGTALIIHDGVDDYHSQPSGNAGNRIACAAIPAK